MLRRLHPLLAALCLFLPLAFAGCAQDVDDIDRTQPNRTLKSELDGEWYMLETVTHVPSTSRASFEGETSRMEKVVWRIEENWLLGYRAYPLVPGSDVVEVDAEFPDGDPALGYFGTPVAAYRIQSHFDVVREYNSSTGEQTNVIIENSWDRPWYEREFMRVDWSRNVVTNFDFISGWFWSPIEATYAVDEERGDPRSIYRERDEAEQLVYFDVPRRLLLEPDLWGCIVSMPWYGWDTQDCAPAEVEIVTSFARTEARRDYEPVTYDDQNMSRFGFFRTERYVHDPVRGVLESTRQELINRHNLWEASYQRDGEGEFLTDESGRLIPIPVAERSARTVPYYMSQTFPAEQLIRDTAREVMEEWNQVGRQTVALAQGIDAAAVDKQIFVLCSNPVAEGEDPACGEVGMEVRPGDLRYSTLHWVESSQLEGPLGYGPSAVDPETGETVSGRAYVYADGLNTYAAYGVDVIRFLNGDLDPELLANLDHVRTELSRRSFGAAGTETAHDHRLDDVPVGSTKMRPVEKMTQRIERREHLDRYDAGVAESRLQRAKDAGLGAMLMDEEVSGALASRLQLDLDPMDQNLDPTDWLSPTTLKRMRDRRMRAMARSVDYPDLFDGNILGVARKYQGRTDYDAIWRELRAEVFRATALHEVGHTLGLRHNFQGTYDSLNYHDEYWALRNDPTLSADEQNFVAAESYGDLYRLNALSEKQIDGRMRDYQYSSIMDYGYTFNTDLEGLGKYDMAAIVYGYTAGSVPMDDAECVGNDRVATGGTCLVKAPGFVEVFAKQATDLGEAGRILSSTEEQGLRFDDPTAPIVPYLERWHYSTFMLGFPSMNDAFDRDWMRLDDVIETRGGAGERVRVPYLFCSDEWVGGLLSCQIFDAGADPFEMTQTITDHYRAFYYFNNFKRDRLGWWPGETLYREFFYTFLPLSDYFQNWYLAPSGDDPVMDDYWWLAINSGFNLIAESIATPSYGTFCVRPNGQLFNLGDEPGLSPDLASDYFLVTYCDPDQDFVEVPQGVGRRHFTAYDFDAGYNFADQPLEAGHYWTTLAAFWAMVDPEAFVLGTDADAGTFAISFYDFFADEVNKVVNSHMTEAYDAYSPVMKLDENGAPTAEIVYQPVARVYDPDLPGYFDPETGVATTSLLGPDRATGAVCQVCEEHSECNGYTGALGGTFCFPIDDTDVKYCTRDCFEDASLCLATESCDDFGTCVPNSGVCEIQACSPSEPYGECPAGQNCVDGACEALWPVVETDATFSLTDDMLFWGMLYSTWNYSTRYNDQINVFRVGTDEEIVPGPGFQKVAFTDPVSGFEYGAIVESCEGGPPATGSLGICQSCEAHSDCAGGTGNLGGAFCQPFEADPDGNFYCFEDCLDNPGACDPGFTCDGNGNCTPDAGRCGAMFVPECGPTEPFGQCAEGTTCFEGECREPASVQCNFGLETVSGGAQMVLRGQALVQRYNETLEAYWADDASDPDRELELYWHHSRAKFELESHVDKISDIRAVYAILGKIY